MGMIYYHGNIVLEQKEVSGYFINRGELALEDNYRKMVQAINDEDYKEIGLMIGGDTYEYPLLSMLTHYDHIEHVNVTNATAKYEDTDFVPDVIIVIDYTLDNDTISCHDAKYRVTQVIDDNICLMKRVSE